MENMEIGAQGAFYSSSLASKGQAGDAARAQRISAKLTRSDDDADSKPKETKEPPRVGFGANSVTLPSVAVNTLRENLSQAGELVPSVAESEARVRERIEEEQRRFAERKKIELDLPKLDLRSGEEQAISRTREFVGNLNDTARAARTRASGEETPQSNRIDIRIGDTTIPLEKKSQSKSYNFLA